MFYPKQITRPLAIVLLALLSFGGMRAQESMRSPQQQDATRQRRANDSSQQPARTPQSTPTPQPTPASDDDLAEQSDDVVRVETDLTSVLFTAADKKKRFVTTLNKDDIRISEDGQPQEIFTFARQTDLPLSLAIVIDTSKSQERTLPEEKAAALAFVDSVMRTAKDEAAVVSFTGEATLEQGLTGNAARVRSAINKVEYVPPSGDIGGGIVIGTPPISDGNQSLAGWTSLWDAIWVTSDEVLASSPDKTRRAIILLTDGVDTRSQKKMSEAIERAVKADAVIYAIGIGDEYIDGIDEGSLKKVSERTGGRAFFPDDETELRAAFAQIEQELRSQYLVAYSPTNKNRDGSYRKVQIEIVNPELRKQNLRLTYRQGYFAKGNQSPTASTPTRK